MNIAANLQPTIAHLTRWEKAATTRWGTYITDVEKQVILRGHAMAGRPAAALEIGCEGGRWSRLLCDRGWKMTCVDVDSSMLGVCQSRIPEATCLLARREDRTLPCAARSQSLLLCVEVAPVIQSDWFLAEAVRVLAVGGILVGTCWNRASLRGWFSAAKLRRHGEQDIFYRETYHSFRRRLRKSKLTLVHEQGFCWSPFNRESNSSLIPGFLLAEKLLCLDRFPPFSPWVAFIARKDFD